LLYRRGRIEAVVAYLNPGDRVPRGVWLSYALALSLLLIAPNIVTPFYLLLICYALVYSIAGVGLNLLLGYGGLLSLGHATYFGLGAYTGAFLWTFTDVNSFEIYVLSGVVLSMVLASIFGLLAVRATKIHFAILTLVFGEIVFSIFFNGTVFRLFGPRGHGLYIFGGGGLYIGRLAIAGVDYAEADRIGFLTGTYYYVILASFVSALLLMWAIVNSNFGKALEASRDNEERAKFVAIRVARTRWAAYVVSAGFTALAGALFGELNGGITPKHLGWYFSVFLTFTVLVGGMRNYLGPVAGAFCVVFIQDSLWWLIGPRWQLWLGILLVSIALLFPSGIVGSFAALYTRATARNSSRPS